MSVKIFNVDTNQWEQISVTVATGMKIVDVNNHFDAENVNDCLMESAAKLETLAGRVEYIYQNGTVGGGGGGGGGGSVLPSVTVDGDLTRNVKSGDLIDIFYFFTSPNQGDGTSSISYANVSNSTAVKQGRTKATVGPFAKGSYTITVMVQDSQGFWSVPLRIAVISGSLDLTSTFTDSIDFTLADNIIIPYTVVTLVSEPVFLNYWIDNVLHSAPAQIGANVLTFGKLQHMGPTFLKMQLHNTTYTSNFLNYALVASDSINLYLIPVSFPDHSDGTTVNTIPVGTNLVLDYRVSMKNQFSFNSVTYVGQFGETRFANVISKPGVNYWNIGVAGFDNLTVGQHIFKIVSSTLDGLHSASIAFAFNVSATDYIPYSHITSNLIAQFDASGKNNSSIDRDIWADTSSQRLSCDLFSFNYTTNGWNNNAIDVSGKSYAVINFAPFAQGIKNGFTCEVVFKTLCAGDVDAKVISCRNPVTPFQGFEINTAQAIFTSTSDTTLATIQENIWTKVSFVVNRGDSNAGRTHTMLMYINGAISSMSLLQPNNPNLADYTDDYSFPGLIYIGAGTDSDGNITNNSVSSIRSIRIYDRALTDVEIVTNFIADITDPDEQVDARKLNGLDANGALDPLAQTLPRLDILCNIDSMDEDAKRQTQQVRYEDPSDPNKNFTADFPDATISWQGTSSKIYPIKNWTLELFKQGNIRLYTPRDEWLPDARWTLKANYMDSSNANNIGLNKFIHDYVKTNDPAFPSELSNPLTRANIDGFPIIMTMNGVFMGIYTWNIDRYGLQNYGFVTYNQTGNGPVVTNRLANAFSYEILANTSDGAGAFKLPYAGGDLSSAAITGNWGAVSTEFRCRYSQDTNPTIMVAIQGVQTEVLNFGKHQQLLTLVEWVSDADDQEFIDNVSKHFSLQHLIDYYLITYVFGMVDNLGKNMVLSTWGANSSGDVIWFPSFYDCDSVMGLNNTGFLAFDAGLDTLTGNYNTSNSNLWVKLNRNFGSRISDRYQAMRLVQNVGAGVTSPPWFSYDTAILYINDKVISHIGPMLYNQDARIKFLPIIPPPGQATIDLSWSHGCNGSRLQFTERWLKERFIYLDSVYEFNYFQKAVVRSNVQGNVTLSVKTYSPQWVKISFTDASDAKIRKVARSTGWTDYTYNITNATDNNIEIYAADNIMFIEGINDLNAGSIDISSAAKLIELDIQGSSRITELSLGSNTYLQRLLCNDCTNLGYQVAQRTLDVSGCTNLRELNVSNTHIQTVRFSPIGGVIETLDASGTDITSFTLAGQEYLTAISLSGCKDLSILEITNCGGLESLIMPNTNLSSVKLTGCNLLSELNINTTRNLRLFDISGSPNLRKLYMSGVSNLALTEVDLSYAPLLETFDMSTSGYIQFVVLPSFPAAHSNEKLKVGSGGMVILDKKHVNQNSIVVRLTDISDAITPFNYTTVLDSITGFIIITLNTSGNVPADQRFIYVSYTNNCSLSNLTCNNSSITSLKFGRTAVYPTRTDTKFALDLNNLPLTDVDFSGCGSLIEVRNIAYTATGSSSPFNGCINLKTITGSITLKGSCSSAFRECNNLVLTGLTLDLTAVTSMADAFWNCNSLTAANVNAILQSVGAPLTTLSRCFSGCTSIIGTLFQTYPLLFNKCSGMISLYECFYGCSGISGTLPAPLLSYMRNLVDATRMLISTNVSGLIPTDFLRFNINLATSVGMFQNTKISNFPVPQANLFQYNVQLTDVTGMFQNTPLVMQIDGNLFITNAKLNNIQYFFYGCTQIFGSIPPDLLNNIPTTNNTNNLAYVNYLFSGTGVSGAIPTNFLDNCKNLQQAEGLFNLGVNFSGSIPTDLLLFNTKLTKVGAMFSGCANLSGVIPPNLLRGKSQIISAFKLFLGCKNIDSIIPEDFLTDCPALTDVSEMFSGCAKLHGLIPDRNSYWFSTENFTLISKIILNVESPDLTTFTVKLTALSAPLVRDFDYKVTINGNFVEITLLSLTPSTLVINLPHSIPMSLGVATIPITGVDQATLVMKNFSGTVFTLTTDYTLNVTGGNVVITSVVGGAMPVDMSTLYVAYDYTAQIDRVAVLNTFNIDRSTPFQVRPTIDNITDNIITKNLNSTGVATVGSTVMMTGLSGADTCIVRVTGPYTGALTLQTSIDNVVWTNIATNALLNLNTNTLGTTIASGSVGVFQFSCSGKQGVRVSANATVTGSAGVSIFVNSVSAGITDYTLATNISGYVELTRNPNSTIFTAGQTNLIITYKHLDPQMQDRTDIINRSTRPSLLGQFENVTNYGFLDKQVNLVNANSLFRDCTHAQFNGTIPPKFFINGSKITDISFLFSECWYLNGSLPSGLLYNCANVTNMTNTFTDCVNIKDPSATHAIPLGFFDNCPKLTTLKNCFSTGGVNALKPHGGILTGTLDKDLFKFNTKLTDISGIFASCPTLNSTLDNDLFKYNTAITTVTGAFQLSGITALGPNLFRTCTAITDISYAFWSCPSLQGAAPTYWASDHPLKAVKTKTGCFKSDAQLTNWNLIPATWR